MYITITINININSNSNIHKYIYIYIYERLKMPKNDAQPMHAMHCALSTSPRATACKKHT